MTVEVRNRTAPPSRRAPGKIDTLFLPTNIATAGLPLDKAIAVRSMADYEAAGGTRAMNVLTYDGLDNFFREGGSLAYVARYTTAATIDAALALFVENLGGGQVVSWDEAPTAPTYGKLQDWAMNTNRYALLDVGFTDDTVAELSTNAALQPVLNADYGAMFGPWVTIPPLAGLIGGAVRNAPATSTVAALCARSDALGNPNRAPAGRDFPLQYATAIVGASPLTDSDAVTLRAAGINPLRSKLGLLVLDGFQTSIDKTPDSPFWQANCGRARMWLKWHALDAGHNYEYKPLDGLGRLARALATDLDAICLQLYNVDGLYGETPEEAFATTVGSSVNTISTIAQGELHAVVEARFSLHAAAVIIDLVSVPVGAKVSAS